MHQTNDFDSWQKEVIRLIVEKQKKPFANYRKNRWKPNGKIMKSMHKESLAPQVAANLWGINHEK